MSAPQVFLTETRERFLKAVVAELPADRIRELYLFAPIRQGGVESGVAVIAAELPKAAESVGSESVGSESVGSESVGSESVGSESAGSESVGLESVGSESAGSESAGSESVGSESADSDPTSEVAPDPRPPTPDAQQAPPDAQQAPPDPRYTVYTARYRHTQKGPDRGRWESSVVAEADAPLLSIETVVRGVQRRSGDVDPPDHLSGDEVRNALRLTPPAASA